MRGMLNLKAFALRFRQGLVVGDFEDNVGDVLAEVADQFLLGRVRVLDRVVQDGGDQDALILDACLVQQEIGQGDGMVDVRGSFSILASLILVLVGGEGEGGHQLFHHDQDFNLPTRTPIFGCKKMAQPGWGLGQVPRRRGGDELLILSESIRRTRARRPLQSASCWADSVVQKLSMDVMTETLIDGCLWHEADQNSHSGPRCGAPGEPAR